MAIEHADNWSIYGGNADLLTNGVYASQGSGASLHADPDPSATGMVLRYDGGFDNGLEQNLRYAFTTPSMVAGKALRQWLSNLPNNANLFPIPITFRNANNLVIADMGVDTTGRLFVRNSQGTVLGTTAQIAITANAWWHIEAKIDVANGTFEIRVEGQQKLLLTGQTFGALPVAQESFATQNNFAIWGGQAYAKDVVWWNGAGSENNDFLGSVIVASLLPASDINLNWTPTPTGEAGYTILGTTPPQDTAVYLDAPNPPPAPYVCSLTDLPSDVTSVKAVITMVRAAKVDGGDGSLQVGMISSPGAGPVTGEGLNRPITTAPTYWRDVFEVDPKTGISWLPAAVNSAQLQINRTT